MRDGTGQTGARIHSRRIRVTQAAFVLLALGYAARLVQLQFLESESWEEAARAQAAARVELPAQRGAILDREGHPLVVDAERYRAYLAPRELSDPAQAVASVTRILGLSAREERRLARAREGWVAIPRRLTGSDRERLMGAVRQGLHFERLTARIRPQGGLATALIGSVDGSGHGTSGLEMLLDSLLQGRVGSTVTRRDALGRTYWLPDGQGTPPVPGNDVVLTIDAELQSIAESALESALEETGASGGDILLMDPRTGELLAVASRKSADLRSVPAFTDPYEPGSTLKPFLLAALLAERRARLTERVDVERGVFREGRRTIRDVHPYDTLTVAEVVRYSSNVGAVKLARRLEPALHYRYLRDFGFGVPTGIEYPAESGGLLRRPADWSALSQASLAMGYEVSVTSLQLAAAYAALANGGVLMRPYLVREVRAPDGTVLYQRRPEPIRRVVKAEVARTVSDVLSSVVAEGTATRAALHALRVAGKTGTARLTSDGRYEQGRYAASFVGFTPADDPRLVILTKLEDPQGAYYGGTVAAPVSQATLRAALATRGGFFPPKLASGPQRAVEWRGRRTMREDGPFIFAVRGGADPWPDPAPAQPESRILPDLRGIPVRAAVARLHELGLRVELRGSGRIRDQIPPPGRRVAVGATILLR